MEYIILRNFTDAKTNEYYTSGRIVTFTKARVEEIQAVEEEKNIKLIRPVKNSGLTKKKRK